MTDDNPSAATVPVVAPALTALVARLTPPEPTPAQSKSIEFLLGIPPEESYDRMARLASASLRAPMAIVSIVEDGRPVVKGCVGVSGRPRAWRSAPGAYDLSMEALAESRPLRSIVPQPGQQGASTGPSVAVAPFTTRDGHLSGMMCVADPDSLRVWSDEDLALLVDLARAMCTELELRRELVMGRDTQDALVHITLHDELTGLPNRAYLVERIKEALARARHDREQQFAVLFLDLDRFKVVNDSIGHHGGDALLVAVARRLSSTIRPEDTVARLGGDEFAVLIESLSTDGDAMIVAERIQRALAGSVDLGGYEVFTSASIGIVLSSSSFLETERPEHLLRSADMAMYRAKAAGRACHAMFDRAMHSDALARLQLETDLRRALGQNEFHLVYQPVVSLETGRITGVEALLRWHHKERGTISPAEFVSIAEDTGLIVSIGEWVLREACLQVKRWETPAGEPPLTMAVNLSVKQVTHEGLSERVAAVLAETGLEPDRLRLEVTESVIMDQPESTTAVLVALKALGVKLHMDDFGTGYSSLSYLHQLPLDGLKVDRAFVSRMDFDDRSRQLVSTVLQLARSIGLVTVAEGVTTVSQLNQLRKLGCESGQGYLFAPPLEADAVAGMLGTRW